MMQGWDMVRTTPRRRGAPVAQRWPSAGSGELMCERYRGTDDVRRLPSRPISHNSSGELALGCLRLGLGTLDRRTGLSLDLVERDAGSQLDRGEGAAPLALHPEHAELGDHDIDHARPGERQRAAPQQL